MNILITGGTGTISSGIARESIKRNYETWAVTRGRSEYKNIDGVKYIHADVFNIDDLKNKIFGMHFDVVVECLVYNVDQLKISLENFGNMCTTYVFISTAGVYSRDGNKRIKESDEKNCVQWEYSRSKIECEEYLKEYCKNNKLKYIIIRPVVTYGEYRVPFPITTRNPGWTFFQRLKDGRPMLACDNVKCSVLHIDDFSYAVVSLFDNPKAVDEDFHIASRYGDIFWDDVINIAAKKLCIIPNIIHVSLIDIKEMWPELYDELKWNKTTDLLMDDTKLLNAVPDFKQKISIDKGIEMIMEQMEKEVSDNGLKLDRIFNEKCDMVLWYAYVNKKVSMEELNLLKEYFYSIEDMKYRVKIRLKVIKMMLKRIKSRVKR